MKLPAAAYSAEVATSATKAGSCGVSCEILRSRYPPAPRLRRVLHAFIPVASYGVFGEGESKGRQKIAGVSRFLLIRSNSARLSAMPRVLHPHIISDFHLCGGSPRIEGSRIPVRTIVVYVLHHGTTPEALLGYYPQLSLAAIYDALSYYYDNREEIDAEIAANAALEPPTPSLA